MSNISTVTPGDIALTLGLPAPSASAIEYDQWNLWIGDAERLIEARLGDLTLLDAANLAYVVREAVALKVKRPDPVSQTTVSVDDGSVAKRYERSGGQIQILDEWWALLTPTSDDNTQQAFSIAPWFDTTAPTL